jgi:hypothetical protein
MWLATPSQKTENPCSHITYMSATNVKIQNFVTIWHVGLKKKVLYINSDEPSVTQIKKK